MSQQFNEVRVGNTSRSTFSLSHHQVTTSDFGYLIPICVRDMVPNDDFVVTPNIFCRLAPLAFPVYGRVSIKVSSFYVPYRILYPHWSEFITQSQANHTIPPFFTGSVLKQALQADPQFTNDSSLLGNRGIYGRLMANLGLNPSIVNSNAISSNERFSAFRWLAYYRIWLDWYMDSNIYDHSQMVAAFNDTIQDGGSLIAQATEFLKYRCACFGKDYFTTAKLHPQAGANPSRVSVDIAGHDLNPGMVESPTAGGASNVQYVTSDRVKTALGTSGNSNSVIGQFRVDHV